MNPHFGTHTTNPYVYPDKQYDLEYSNKQYFIYKFHFEISRTDDLPLSVIFPARISIKCLLPPVEPGPAEALPNSAPRPDMITADSTLVGILAELINANLY